MDEKINHWTIYMYTFPNGKRYVGATTRPLTHRQGTDWSKYKRCKLLYAAIQEYGIEEIEQTILFEGMMENRIASELEAFFIDLYKTNANRYNNPSYGYNQTDGGEGTTKKVISEKRREQLRKQVDEFHKAKIGTHPSDETRRRLSESHMGQTRGIMSMETRLKISRSNTSNKEEQPVRYPNKGPKQAVIMKNLETGEIHRFESCTEAGRFFGVKSGTVSRWINGNRRPPDGYLFTKEADFEMEEEAAS